MSHLFLFIPSYFQIVANVFKYVSRMLAWNGVNIWLLMQSCLYTFWCWRCIRWKFLFRGRHMLILYTFRHSMINFHQRSLIYEVADFRIFLVHIPSVVLIFSQRWGVFHPYLLTSQNVFRPQKKKKKPCFTGVTDRNFLCFFADLKIFPNTCKISRFFTKILKF